jgi:hypothetical protein
MEGKKTEELGIEAEFVLVVEGAGRAAALSVTKNMSPSLAISLIRVLSSSSTREPSQKTSRWLGCW